MKNRYFTGTLILLVLLTCGILIKADSQIQQTWLPQTWPKFKVGVYVQCDNKAYQSQVEGAIKRELRSFGDVQIVGNDTRNGLWEYMISIQLFGIEGVDGNFMFYATSIKLYEKVPIGRIVPHWQEHYRKFPAVYLPANAVGTCGINKLEDFGKAAAADFDKKLLQSVRDSRIRYSK